MIFWGNFNLILVLGVFLLKAVLFDHRPLKLIFGTILYRVWYIEKEAIIKGHVIIDMHMFM